MGKLSSTPQGFVLAVFGIYTACLGEGLSLAFPFSSKLAWSDKFPSLNSTIFHLALPLGGIFGTIISSVCTRVVERKAAVSFAAIKALVALALLQLSSLKDTEWLLYVGLFLMGAACGIVRHTAPCFLHEVSHHTRRGMIVSGYPTVLAIGFSVSLMIGSSVSVGTLTNVTVLPFLLSTIVLRLSPASPLWLAETGRSDEQVQNALTQLHGPTEFAQKQFQLLTSRKVEMFSKNIKPASVRKPLLVSLGLMLLSQVSGINALNILFYNHKAVSLATTVAIGLTHVSVSLVAVFLHDWLGRKMLLYISSVFELLGLLILGLTWTSTWLGALTADQLSPMMTFGACVCVGGQSLGAESIPWIMVNELLPGKAKTIATATSTTSSWFIDAIMTPMFETLLKVAGGPWTFFTFSVFVVISFIFVRLCVPETSGLTVEELEKTLRRLYDKVFEESTDPEALTMGERKNESQFDIETSENRHGQLELKLN